RRAVEPPTCHPLPSLRLAAPGHGPRPRRHHPTGVARRSGRRPRRRGSARATVTPMRRATVGGLVLLCALVTVCPADGDRSAAPGDGDLRALLQPSRPFETRGALRVDVSNLGDEDVRITSLRLDSPLYEPQGPQPRDPLLEADGGTVVMPVLLGEPVCDAEAGPARLVLGVAGGEVPSPWRSAPRTCSPTGTPPPARSSRCARRSTCGWATAGNGPPTARSPASSSWPS